MTVPEMNTSEPDPAEAGHQTAHVDDPASRRERFLGACQGMLRATRRFSRDPRKASVNAWQRLRQGGIEYFRQPASFFVVLAPLLVVSALVYTRSLWTNFIFDEQEALLANPYVNGTDLGFLDVFRRDFWGLPPDRTIGTYRPIPNMLWRIVWQVKHHAWLPHFLNVLGHGINGALLALVAGRWLKSRMAAWFAGLSLVLSAIITEAVAGVVGLADVTGGTFILLCLLAISLSWYWAALATCLCLFLGLLCKESTMTVTPVIGWAALVASPLVHPERPRRWLRFVTVALAAVVAVVAYTYFRRHFFPIKLTPELERPLADSEPVLKWALHEFLRWFQQPKFATDPINNPLVSAEPAYRVAGALRVYFWSLVQIVFPWQLSGDYSFPQEPIPERLVFPASVLGGLLMAGPPLLAVGAWLRGMWTEFGRRWQLRQWSIAALNAEGGWLDNGCGRLTWITPRLRGLAVLAVGAMWVPLTFFPQSNIPLIMPTVRAERFWYVPVLGSSLLLGWAFSMLWERARRHHFVKPALVFTVLFFGFQATRARMHASDYRNDLAFWRATAKAVPNSAKAHLNYGVMLGARKRLEERLLENKRAMELAPKWTMANIYYGDTLCRLKRPDEAIEHYQNGFELGPNDQYMIALALQCLWDEKAFERHEEKLSEQAKRHKGSWLAFLVNDMAKNGETHEGVDPKYRPRGYNQGPRKDTSKDAKE
jgi:tetratricopeptide (TPR) repeat protein